MIIRISIHIDGIKIRRSLWMTLLHTYTCTYLHLPILIPSCNYVHLEVSVDDVVLVQVGEREYDVAHEEARFGHTV